MCVVGSKIVTHYVVIEAVPKGGVHANLTLGFIRHSAPAEWQGL
jgi:hypothetical protein